MHCLHTPGLMSLSSLLNAVQTVRPMSCGTSLSRSLQLFALVLRSLTVTLSTAESEYVALSGCVQEVIWTRRVLSFLGFPVVEPTVVYEDNEAAEALACNEIMTKRSRFIDARFHYVREMVAEKEISVKRCATSDMVADLFTKGLPRVTFEKHWEVARGQRQPGNLSLGAIAALTRRACAVKSQLG